MNQRSLMYGKTLLTYLSVKFHVQRISPAICNDCAGNAYAKNKSNETLLSPIAFLDRFQLSFIINRNHSCCNCQTPKVTCAFAQYAPSFSRHKGILSARYWHPSTGSSPISSRKRLIASIIKPESGIVSEPGCESYYPFSVIFCKVFYTSLLIKQKFRQRCLVKKMQFYNIHPSSPAQPDGIKKKGYHCAFAQQVILTPCRIYIILHTAPARPFVGPIIFP